VIDCCLVREQLDRCYPVRIGPASCSPFISIEELVDVLNECVDLPTAAQPRSPCCHKKEESPTDLCEALPRAFSDCITPALFREKFLDTFGCSVGKETTALISHEDFDAGFGKAVRESSFRRKLEASYPRKIGANGIFSDREFTQALLRVLDDDTLRTLLARVSPSELESDAFQRSFEALGADQFAQKVLDSGIAGTVSHTIGFHCSGVGHHKYLQYAGAAPATTSDEVPAVVPEDVYLQTLTFANSKPQARAVLYLFKNLTDNVGDPKLDEAVYQWLIPEQHTAHYSMVDSLLFKAGDTLSVYCVDSQRTAANICFELHLRS
jgi:hypothetical protein